jgi:hypothetical protein
MCDKCIGEQTRVICFRQHTVARRPSRRLFGIPILLLANERDTTFGMKIQLSYPLRISDERCDVMHSPQWQQTGRLVQHLNFALAKQCLRVLLGTSKAYIWLLHIYSSFI